MGEKSNTQIELECSLNWDDNYRENHAQDDFFNALKRVLMRRHIIALAAQLCKEQAA